MAYACSMADGGALQELAHYCPGLLAAKEPCRANGYSCLVIFAHPEREIMSFAVMLANLRDTTPINDMFGQTSDHGQSTASSDSAEAAAVMARQTLASLFAQEPAPEENTPKLTAAPSLVSGGDADAVKKKAALEAFFHSMELSDQAFGKLLEAKGDYLSTNEIRWLAAHIANGAGKHIGKQNCLLRWAQKGDARIEAVLDGLIRLDRLPD